MIADNLLSRQHHRRDSLHCLLGLGLGLLVSM
jgi:hypothetical protein